MKILLLSANTMTRPYPVYPLGIDHVAAAIGDDHQVEIVDLNVEPSVGLLAATIERICPDAIGISLRNVDNTEVSNPQSFIEHYRTIVAIARKHSAAPIILGGSGFTIFPELLMHTLEADYGVVGEGERLGALLEAIDKNTDASSLPGVITRNTGTRPQRPLDQGPICDFKGKRPHLPYYIKNGGMLNLQTQRGCPFNCIYCTYPKIEGHPLRKTPPEQVASTALRLQNAGAKYFFITDSTFNADAEHSLAVAAAFKQAGISIPWGAFFAPLEPLEDYFGQMAAAGLSHVEFGTESLANPVLAAYRKPFRAKQIHQSHRAAIDAGLYVAHYLLLGGPGEDSDTLEQTLTQLDSLERCVLFFFCGMRIYPNTALHAMAVGAGQVLADDTLLAPAYYRAEAIGPDEIIKRVRDYSKGRINWVIGSGGPQSAKTIAKLYARGYTGPLWEYLIG